MAKEVLYQLLNVYINYVLGVKEVYARTLVIFKGQQIQRAGLN